MATSDTKGRFFYKTYRFESIRITNRIEYIRIANWNALALSVGSRDTRANVDGRHLLGGVGLCCRATRAGRQESHVTRRDQAL